MSEAPLGLLGVLGVLLVFSGFLSSSETALFSLTPLQKRSADVSVRELLGRPRALLITILLGNLVVNLLFFAFAARLGTAHEGATGGFVVGFGALIAILLFGEILPKTIGLRSRVRVARFSAPILRVCVFLSAPVRTPVLVLLERFNTLITSWIGEEKRLTPEVLAAVLERGAEEGLLLDTEADLLAEIIELTEIRVREIMTPRVDALFLDINTEDREEILKTALQSHYQSWLPVIDGTPDRVVGRVRIRDLVKKKDRPTRQLVMPVKFVPEVASALDLLRSLDEDRTNEAIVVDEWGGTAGVVTSEDVFEEIVGDLRTEGELRVPAAVPLGEGRFRVAGSLSIRDWNERFGLAVVPMEFETVGGFVTALLGRIPRAGDRVRVENLLLEVNEVRGRRVVTVDLRVEDASKDGGDKTERPERRGA